MMNEVNINFLIIAIVLGAVGLAAIYHTILFTHRRTKILASYCSYLWVSFLYILFRFYYPYTENANNFIKFFNPDETLQILSFTFYVHFMGVALDLDKKKDRRALFFVALTPWMAMVYILFQIILANIPGDQALYVWAKIYIRVYLLLFGLYILLFVVLKRRKVYYSYLAAGAVSMILFGIISSAISIMDSPGKYMIGPISWLMLGYFTDVIFFSSAIGYRIKIDAQEKKVAIKKLMQQSVLLQEKEIEKIQAIYITKEKERQRIANDLHDDIGASLSSLQIYSTIAAKTLENNPARSYEMLEKIEKQSKLLMENLSDIVWSMNTMKEQVTSLETRIKNYGSDLLADNSINLLYKIAPGIDNFLKEMPIRKNVWLIIKEALNNMVKYSKAQNATLELYTIDRELLLEIKDDGAGFEIDKKSPGNGLLNIQNRVTELNGKFYLYSKPGEGTQIKAQIPLSQDN